MGQLPKKPLAFIIYFLKDYKIILFLLWLFAFSRDFISSNLIFYTLKIMVDSFETINNSDVLTYVIQYATIFVLEFLLWIVLNASVPTLNAYSNGKAEKNMRKELFSYISKQPYDYFINTFGGNLANKVNNVTSSCQETVLLLLDDIPTILLNLILYIVVFYYFNPFLALIMFIWLSIAISIAFILFKKLKQKSYNIAETKSAYSGTLVDILGNISAVKSNSREKYELSRVKRDSDSAYNAFKDYSITKSFSRGVVNFISIIFMISIISFCVYLRSENLITIGSFVFVTSAILKTLWKIYDITEALLVVNENFGTISEGLEKLLKPHTILDKEKAKILKVFSGKIEIKDLFFEYKLNKGSIK